MSNTTLPDQLPIEWQSAINSESANYAANQRCNSLSEALYIDQVHKDGLKAYALRAYKAEQEVERLRNELYLIANGADPCNESQAWSWIETARNIANRAITPQTNNNE